MCSCHCQLEIVQTVVNIAKQLDKGKLVDMVILDLKRSSMKCGIWDSYEGFAFMDCHDSYTAKLLIKSLCCDWTVTMWWLFLYLLVALMEGYKTMYLCHLDSYTVTVCTRYLVSSHVVTLQLPTRCLVDRFLRRPHGSGYQITCMSNVVTVQ